jgi:hypothetical protein
MIEGVHSREGFATTKGILDEVYLRYVKKGEPKRWPFKWDLDFVIGLFNHVFGRLNDNNFVVDERWDETTAELARIVNSERKQAKFADDWLPPN